MLVKAAALGLVLIGLFSASAGAQRNRPLFLDTRTGDDPAVIDVTEITGQYLESGCRGISRRESPRGAKGNRAAAREHLEAAIRIEPDFFNAHNSLAILFHRMNAVPDAEREYREARKAESEVRGAAGEYWRASRRAKPCCDCGRGSKRASSLERGLGKPQQGFEIQPGAPLAEYLTGVVYYLTAFYEESRVAFQEGAGTGDQMILARLALADIYIRFQEWDSVVVQLDEYLERVPWLSNRVQIRAVRKSHSKNWVLPSNESS